jgi:hypothetical protein
MEWYEALENLFSRVYLLFAKKILVSLFVALVRLEDERNRYPEKVFTKILNPEP